MRAAPSVGTVGGRGPPAFARVILIGCALMDRYPSQARMCRGCSASESNKYKTGNARHSPCGQSENLETVQWKLRAWDCDARSNSCAVSLRQGEKQRLNR